jgi:hypothetical protein
MKKQILFLTGLIISLLVFGILVVAEDPIPLHTSASITINQFMSITISSGAPVDFGSLNPNDNNKEAINDPLTIHVGEESNINVMISTQADRDFINQQDSGHLFPVSQMSWARSNSGPWNSYSTSKTTVCSSISPGNDCQIYHEISAPGGMASGIYTAGITITGEISPNN